MGKHGELMKNCDIYREIYESQRSKRKRWERRRVIKIYYHKL